MYPVWLLPTIGTFSVIAVIASFHILPSHLATGSFWFNVYIERKAYRENRPELLEFLKKYVLLILIFSFVFGSLSGVGIWFAATVSSPRAISSLIHNYVWGWATEWVFFIIEIVAIYVYYYTMDKVDPYHHLRIGWIYAWGAWISMVIITGILAFMLTPGKWLETGGFFDGFFNPTYWPQLFSRTFFMFTVAAVYALIVVGTLKNQEIKEEIGKKASIWGILGTVLGALFSWWYISKLPKHSKVLLRGELPYLKTLLWIAGVCGAILFVFFLFGLLSPRKMNPWIGIIAAVVLFIGIGAGESFRESVRRPYIIGNFMYSSNQVIAKNLPAKGVKEEVTELSEKGYLSKLYYLPKGLSKEEIGKVLVAHECSGCHTLSKDGVVAPLPRLLGGMDKEEIMDLLDSLGDYPYMPPFVGNEFEKEAAAEYLEKLAKTAE